MDMYATVHNTCLPQFMSKIPEPLALAVDALSQDMSMYMFLPFPLLSKVIQKLCAIQEAEVFLIAPWWPSQPWFPHTPTSTVWITLCSFIPSRSAVTAGTEIHLGRNVLAYASMEALMQHYKAAEFADEFSKLAAAPRRPSTIKLYV